jgi:signal transduction histidine kinase
LASFLIEHMEEIVGEWEAFARTMTPAATTMDSLALRDHARQMLEAMAKDIHTSQTDREQALKSKGLGPDLNDVETAAAAHGVLRQQVGFDLGQLVAEFRALRASVLRIWVAKEQYSDPVSAYEMTRFNESIDQALAESVATFSEELTKSRDTFLGMLGHDLRSPLSAVAGALHILAKSKEESARASAEAAGARSVAAMSSMIRDLLEYTRTRLGKGIPIVPASANLESVCKTAISEISLVHPQTAFRFESGGSLEGVFDLERMHQVISNLLNNAVQHGERGVPVSLVVGGDSEALSFHVTNAGRPIAPADLQAIFEPLVQLPKEGEEAHTSTNVGLGLFIAREIVLAHGGTIEATSSATAGTTFTVVLPRQPGSRAITQALGEKVA